MDPTLSLHQLRALTVLLEERSVTRAARRLGVSQPALSHTLRGLREALADPLLVTGNGGMVLTPRAERLAPALRRSLRDLDHALAPPPPTDPAGWNDTLVLAAWDVSTLTVLPGLLADMRREAPGLSLDVIPVPADGAAVGLEAGLVDLSLEVRPLDTPGLRTRALVEDDFACVVRRDHPDVGETLDLATYLRLPHALISPQGSGPSMVDAVLQEGGHRRHVALRIRYFLAAPLVVARTDLILTAPRSLCERLAEIAPLRVLTPPLALRPYTTQMVWHARTEVDPIRRWLRAAVIRAARPLAAARVDQRE